jgi:hypothetical protein
MTRPPRRSRSSRWPSAFRRLSAQNRVKAGLGRRQGGWGLAEGLDARDPHKRLDLLGTFQTKVRSWLDRPSPRRFRGTSVNSWVLGGRSSNSA